jgi:hypothetical protein
VCLCRLNTWLHKSPKRRKVSRKPSAADVSLPEMRIKNFWTIDPPGTWNWKKPLKQMFLVWKEKRKTQVCWWNYVC